MAQAAVFDRAESTRRGHALGWSLPGVALICRSVTDCRRARTTRLCTRHAAHGGRGGAWALLVVAALWSLTDLRSAAAAAISHTILSGRGPVFGAVAVEKAQVSFTCLASLLTASTFAMTRVELVALSTDAPVGLAVHCTRHHCAQRGESVREKGGDFPPGRWLWPVTSSPRWPLVRGSFLYDGKTAGVCAGELVGPGCVGRTVGACGTGRFCVAHRCLHPPVPSPFIKTMDREGRPGRSSLAGDACHCQCGSVVVLESRPVGF